jgi:hypothetical protein
MPRHSEACRRPAFSPGPRADWLRPLSDAQRRLGTSRAEGESPAAAADPARPLPARVARAGCLRSTAQQSDGKLLITRDSASGRCLARTGDLLLVRSVARHSCIGRFAGLLGLYRVPIRPSPFTGFCGSFLDVLARDRALGPFPGRVSVPHRRSFCKPPGLRRRPPVACSPIVPFAAVAPRRCSAPSSTRTTPPTPDWPPSSPVRGPREPEHRPMRARARA